MKKRDLDHPRDHNCYTIRINLFGNTVIYNGKGVEIEKKDGTLSESCRALSHRNDIVSELIKLAGPENCEFDIISGLTRKESEELEAILISFQNGSRMQWGQKRWNGEKFLNKRDESIDTKPQYFDLLNGNNYFKTLRRQINRD